MSTTEGAVVEQSDALEYDYSYGNTAVEDGGESGVTSQHRKTHDQTCDFRLKSKRNSPACASSLKGSLRDACCSAAPPTLVESEPTIPAV